MCEEQAADGLLESVPSERANHPSTAECGMLRGAEARPRWNRALAWLLNQLSDELWPQAAEEILELEA